MYGISDVGRLHHFGHYGVFVGGVVHYVKYSRKFQSKAEEPYLYFEVKRRNIHLYISLANTYWNEIMEPTKEAKNIQETFPMVFLFNTIWNKLST